MDENAKRLARAVVETRQQLARGEFSAFPALMPKRAPAARAAPAKPAAPVKPQMSEIARQSREELSRKFDLLAEFNAIAAEHNEPDHNVAVECVERGLSPAEARGLFASRAAQRQWAGALAGTQSMN